MCHKLWQDSVKLGKIWFIRFGRDFFTGGYINRFWP